jgi:hypothetical protein
MMPALPAEPAATAAFKSVVVLSWSADCTSMLGEFITPTGVLTWHAISSAATA